MSYYCLNVVPMICIGPTTCITNYDEHYLYNYVQMHLKIRSASKEIIFDIRENL